MSSRVLLVLSAAFWLTMNYLLWRSEFGVGTPLGTAVPTELIWRKILNAPDNSPMDVYHHGKKQGYCRWTVGSASTPVFDPGDDSTTVPVLPPPGYRITLDGNLNLDNFTNGFKFGLNLKLSTNQDWEEVDLRVSVHENSATIHSLASEKKIRLRTDNAGDRNERVFTFAQLQNPLALAGAFSLPLPLELFGVPPVTTNTAAKPLPEMGFSWTARNDHLTIGHASVRVYRLQTTLADKYRAVIFISPVGEILRVELPDGWLLINDEAAGL